MKTKTHFAFRVDIWDDSGELALMISSKRSSLLPYRGVLSFRSEAREVLGSETPRVYRAARRRGGLAAAQQPTMLTCRGLLRPGNEARHGGKEVAHRG